ncbi:site-specific integrase [Mycobacterium vulneris]|uniref:Site-specific integrase n=1 Tax=Mycolicibacterium vulneris TaxID=547163 RepID=A0A1X2L9N2_9MYCO|nr:site-specific integrase [Mycolicibacterium vulneris]OSC30692.1 site-specific integrase [Mycolicibacterium vulneris]
MATIESYETISGTTRYAVRFRQPNGKQTTKRGFTRKRDAQTFANDVEVKKLSGTYVAPSMGRVTVGSLAPAWLARKKKSSAPSHYRTLETAWRVHVESTWGNVPLADVDLIGVEDWITDLSDKSPTVVLRAYGVLSGILTDAVKGRRLQANPAKGVDNLPKKLGKRRVYLSADDVALLADKAGEHRALVLVLAYCGLRWGEAIGLRVRDVQFLRRRISVSSNAVQIGVRHEVGPTKGREARSVPVPQFVLNELSVACAGKGLNDLVFSTPDGRYLPRPKSSNGWFTRAVRAAGVQSVTPHDLRHTCASLAVSAGVNVLALARMLGHKDPSVTLRVYADLFDTDLDAVAATLHSRYAREVTRRNTYSE